MSEFLDFVFSGANLVPTLLLLFVLMYWLIVIVGVLDIDFLKFDVDVDISNDTDISSSVLWVNHVLAFFNLGKIPLMVFVSFFALPFWMIGVLMQDFLHTNTTLIGFALLIPLAAVCLFIAKFLTLPFVSLFKYMQKEDRDVDENAVGKMCTIVLRCSHDRLGQAAVTTDGAPHLVNVRTREGFSLEKGSSGLIIDYHQSGNYYLVEPFELKI